MSGIPNLSAAGTTAVSTIFPLGTTLGVVEHVDRTVLIGWVAVGFGLMTISLWSMLRGQRVWKKELDIFGFPLTTANIIEEGPEIVATAIGRAADVVEQKTKDGLTALFGPLFSEDEDDQ